MLKYKSHDFKRTWRALFEVESWSLLTPPRSRLLVHTKNRTIIGKEFRTKVSRSSSHKTSAMD